jgi:cold shock protein
LQNCARRFQQANVIESAGHDAVLCLRTSKRERHQRAAVRSHKREGAQVRVTGKVKFFNESKGFGFFVRDDGSGDVFVHRSELPADVKFLYEGQPVSFDIENTTRGLRAVNIEVG